MKYIIYLVLLIFITGCKGNGDYAERKSPAPAKESVKLIRAFSNSDKWDSIYVYSDGHLNITEDSGERFFLISYQTLNKEGGGEITGCLYLDMWDFPTKRYIDSLAYDGFEKKRECYQHIVVLNIIEFKTKRDYNSFIIGAGNMEGKKSKKCCKSSDIFTPKLNLLSDTSQPHIICTGLY